MHRPRLDRAVIVGAAGIALALLLAFAAGRWSTAARLGAPDASAGTTQAAATLWTCSMHPQFQLPKPGQCPICLMDLIPLTVDGDDEVGPRVLSVSEHAAALMEIETTAVVRREVAATVSLVGHVDYDETRLVNITAWVAGRLDQLFVDYTGLSVEPGDPMVSLYSPDLLGAQEELLQALKAARQLGAGEGSSLHAVSLATVEAVREKLRLWGLTAEQVAAVEQQGHANDHVTITAPVGGVVIEKHAKEGMVVQTGARLYTIANLAELWVTLDAYESDLAWLRVGQPVSFTTEAHPGETFAADIAFIHPMLDPATRTVKVRLNLPNPEGRLKPGMFVRATAAATLTAEGRVLERDTPADDAELPLVIPATAPLLTGKRAVVYVRVPDMEKPTFEGREIVLGPRAGDHYLVRGGLEAGELVVTKGAFKLDAELQILGRPSMMSPPPEAPVAAPAASAAPQPQTLCPVMGGAINPEVYTDYEGMRIYFCCGGCDSTFLADPKKYLDAMRAQGVEPERLEKHAH